MAPATCCVYGASGGTAGRIGIEFTKDAAGRMTGMVAVLRDVTARFEQRKTLRRGLAALEPH